MPEHPFPDHPNAEVCVHTGGPANAVAGRYGSTRVTGWYGCTVVDLDDFLLVVDPAFPAGPVCDAVLREALADGRLFDPDDILYGKVRIEDVPDAVVTGLVRLGVERGGKALASEDGEFLGLHVPPVRDIERDDPLSVGLMAGVMGHLRQPGPDLELAGVLMVLLAAARGRPTDPAAMEPAVASFLERLRGRDDLFRAILAA